MSIQAAPSTRSTPSTHLLSCKSSACSRRDASCFVPSHTEYDAAFLTEITATVLTALGSGIGQEDVGVVLPADGAQGRAAITFLFDGPRETIGCDFLEVSPG